MAHTAMRIAIAKLSLDKNNARHDPVDHEAEAIRYLVKKEKADKIAESIAKIGSLNPLESIGVVDHPTAKGRFVVIEGNRRVCALKILNDPDLAPTPELKKRAAQFVSAGKPIPSSVDVVHFDSEDEAAVFIAMRHEGEQDGVGTRPWSTTSKAKHAKKRGNKNPNQLAVALLDYAVKWNLIAAAESSQIAATTLTRYLSNPVVRSTLGLTSGSELLINVPKTEFDPALTKFLTDALPKAVTGLDPKVSSRTNASQRRDYATNLNAAGTAPSTRLKTPIPLQAPTQAVKRARPMAPDPDKRSQIVPGDFRYRFADKVLTRILKELKTIDADDFGFAAGFLLRAVMERLVNGYCTTKGIGSQGRMEDRLNRAIKHLRADAANIAAMGQREFNAAMQPLDQMTHSNSPISFFSLGAWVHGSDIPTRAEVNRRWDSLEAGARLLAAALP